MVNGELTTLCAGLQTKKRLLLAVHIDEAAIGHIHTWLTPTVYLADSDGLDARTLRDLRNAVMPHPWHGFRDCLKQALSSSHWWS